MFRKILGLLFVIAVALPLAASAQITFAFTGTIKSSYSTVYQVGQSITLNLTLAPDLSNLPGYGTSADYYWIQENASDPLFFQDVTFTGASGTWSRPTGANAESSMGMQADSLLFISVGVDNDQPGPSSTGLFVGTDAVKYVFVQGFNDWSPVGLPPFAAPAPDPNQYFPHFAGYTYSYLPETSDFYSEIVTNAGTITFDPISLTITAVPEPTTTAAMALAAVLLGFNLWRRRRTS